MYTDKTIKAPDFDEWSYDEPALLCPVCQHDFTHHERTTAYIRAGEDGDTTATTVDRREGVQTLPSDKNPSRRRDAVVLTFSCEQGHDFTITFVQHKGVTFVTTEET